MHSKISFAVISILVILLLGLTGCFNITVQPPGTPTTPTTPPSSGTPTTPPSTPPTPPEPPPPPPAINSFSAIPGTIISGGSSVLSWNVSDATSVSISPGIGTVALAGNIPVSPGTTTDYVLTATNAAGPATAVTQVAVFTIIGLPVINSFFATPPSFIVGSSTLTWNVSNATSVSITPGIGPVGSVGTRSVSPSATTLYTLTASNPAGSVFHTIQVTKIILTPLPKFPINPLPKLPLDPAIPKFPIDPLPKFPLPGP
jgi:hypothetical protein